MNETLNAIIDGDKRDNAYTWGNSKTGMFGSFVFWGANCSVTAEILGYDEGENLGVVRMENTGNLAAFRVTGEPRIIKTRDYRREVKLALYQITTEVEGNVIVAGIGDRYGIRPSVALR